MPRKTLADRLQAGLEMVPLDKRTPEQFANSLDARQGFGPNTKPWVRRLSFITSITAITVVGLTFVGLGVEAVASNIWWQTKTDMVCVVDGNTHHDTYGKSGYLGTVYDIDTTTCGQLQVTGGGGGLDEQEAETLGRSLHVGTPYEMDVRGWLGWPDEPRAIVSAHPEGATQ
ncbi:hypothetical protein A0130_02650 [Leifsonia xyli]|uniref:hypothetical protein n=1 Tax=Leifsonia xyli TaxID=1575 RepID=UPI0007CDEC87|nr:hypothetical protein A0130_02650 [Leifsonia xyli]